MITTFDIGGGADAKRFTLAGNKLTFKATAFKARNNTYRVNIRVLHYGYSKSFISRLGRGKGPRAKPSVEALLKDFNLNTISITLGFERN
jgi:hypothetical protein